MKKIEINMVQECTDSYRVTELPDGRTRIDILVPARFASMWISKLSELSTDPDEIESFSEG